MSSPVLDIRGLQVWFSLAGRGELHAVRGVSLTVRPGERIGLVGESGCGKTTAILTVMGLLPPSATVSGQVLLGGQDIMAGGEATIRPHRWRDIAMVFQGAMNAFNPVQTIGRQIAEPMRLHSALSRKAARARAGELLELVGIPASRAGGYPHEFSGGMRQRAALAMALACAPKVLLADEPTTALDVIVQAQILELLRSVTAELGVAMIFVSHDLPAVAQVCDRAAVMYAGTLVEEGPVGSLLREPRHPYTRMLFGATPDLRAAVPPRPIPGTPPRLDEPIAGCAFAPRCDQVLGRCTAESPAWVPVAADRSAACHRNVSLAPLVRP